jgi:hypothetical protein
LNSDGAGPQYLISNFGRLPFAALRQDIFELFSRFSDRSLCAPPVDTRIGHGTTVLEFRKIGRDRLVAAFDIALDHHADDGPIAFPDLVHAVRHHETLQVVLLDGIRVRAFDDDFRINICFV